MASVVAKVYRSQIVESVHRGSWVIVDAQGRIAASQGDPYLKTFFRSAAKPIQALPIVESGAADRFGFTDAELAVMCASHSGEPEHIQTVTSILNKLGLDHHALQCGVHPPRDQKSLQALIQAGEKPNQLYNNCSGKHAGMLALSMYHHWDLNNYIEIDHPLQQLVLSYISDFCGVEREQMALGIDGCGVPVFGFSIYNMALAWARLADPSGLSPERAGAVQRITEAMRSYPILTAGTGELTADLMRAYLQYKLVAKSGAEAVYCLTLPDRGWGLALKIEDGSSRAVAAVLLAILDKLGYIGDSNILEAYRPQLVRNHRGRVVGEIVADLSEAKFERIVDK